MLRLAAHEAHVVRFTLVAGSPDAVARLRSGSQEERNLVITVTADGHHHNDQSNGKADELRARGQGLRRALFSTGSAELPRVDEFSDLDLDRADLASPGHAGRERRRRLVAQPREVNLRSDVRWKPEILLWNLGADRQIRDVDDYAGERGLLEQFGAFVVAKPKA